MTKFLFGMLVGMVVGISLLIAWMDHLSGELPEIDMGS